MIRAHEKKSREKSRSQNPPVRNTSHPGEEWARSAKEKAKYLAGVFIPNNENSDDEILVTRDFSSIPRNIP